MKTFVITISERFPVTHPKAGQPTDFEPQLLAGKKKHTIRSNYVYWKKKVDKVNAGLAVLSIRKWSGKPYASKQTVVQEITRLGIQKCEIISYPDRCDIIIDGIMQLHSVEADIMKNDGLSKRDFISWFPKHLVNGCIIHFTDLRY